MRSTEPLGRLVRFQATDRVPLSGMLFEPKKSDRCVIWLHGTGGSSIFHSSRTNILAHEFLASRIAFFPFDNRGARMSFAFETIRDAVKDIDGAVRELRRRGYRDLTLAGHSTGANKIAVYDHYKPRNAIKRYVLFGGADDAGILYSELGPRRFRSLLERAKKLRRSDELMPGRLMSWRAFYDMTNPEGDYNVFPFGKATRGRRPFRFIRGIRKPALYIYGEDDEYGFDAERLAENIGPNGEIVVVERADHGFHGKEAELARLIINWM